jgi:hypothetical protein
MRNKQSNLVKQLIRKVVQFLLFRKIGRLINMVWHMLQITWKVRAFWRAHREGPVFATRSSHSFRGRRFHTSLGETNYIW